MKPYQYLPLDLNGPSLRLVELLPARYEDSPICCRISHASLRGDMCVPYDALSYAWGDPAITKEIYVVDVVPIFSKLSIAMNLHSALKVLRDTHRFKKFIWIDAICIDQSDLKERGHQVQRMLDIYSCADVVRIWLGPEENKHGNSLKGLVKYRRSRKKNDQFFELLASYLNRPWFKRLWVVQEVVAAKYPIFMCGGDTIDAGRLANLVAASLKWRLSSRIPPSAIATITLIRRMRRLWQSTKSNKNVQTSRQSHGLIELVNTFFLRETSDERDKIYALIGISKDAYNAETLYPNYNLSQRQVLYDLIHFSLGNAVNIIRFGKEDAITLQGDGFLLGDVQYPCNSFETPKPLSYWAHGTQNQSERVKWFVDLLSPQNILTGDLVYLFRGTSIPLIIRPSQRTFPFRHSIVQFLTGNIRSYEGHCRWHDFIQGLSYIPHIQKRRILLKWDPWSAPPKSEWAVIPWEFF